MISLARPLLYLFALACCAACVEPGAAQNLSTEVSVNRAREALFADPARPVEAEEYLKSVLEEEPDNLAARELDLWRDYRFGSSFLLPFRTADRLRRARRIIEADSSRQLAHLVAGLIRYSDYLDSYQTVRFRSFTTPGRAVGVDDRITDAAAYLFDTEVEIDDGDAQLSMRDPTSTGWRMDYTSLADAEYEYAAESVHHLEASLDSDVFGLTAHRYLAEILLRTGQLDAGVRASTRLVEAHPDVPEGWMFRGMFRARTGDWSGADADFAAAFARVSERTQRTMTSPELFTAERDGGNRDGQTANTDFWLENDPLWSTDENEALIEHVARMVEADLLFGQSAGGPRGWNSDAGNVYVRYGPPVVTARYNSLTEGYMLLHYGDRRFMFMMPGRRGSYTFYSPPATAYQGSRSNIRQWSADQEIAAREVFREEPRRSTVMDDRRMDVSSIVTRFAGNDPGFAVVWCLSRGSDAGITMNDVDIVELLALFDGSDSPSRVVRERRPTATGSGEYSGDEYSGDDSCPVHVLEAPASSRAGRYSLEVLAGDRAGTVRFDVSEAEATDSMTMSDLMPASLVVEGAGLQTESNRLNTLHRRGHEIHPVGSATFERGRNLYLYFELYDTGTDVTGPVTARVQAALIPEINTNESDEAARGDSGALERLIGRVFGQRDSGQRDSGQRDSGQRRVRQSDSAPVSVDFDEQISTSMVNRYLILRTDELEPGRYVVAVRVSIPDTERTVQSSRSIEITDND